MNLRPFKPNDTEQIIALMDRVYREYGYRVCLESSERDLNDIPAYFESGTFMVMEDEDGIIRGTVALTRDADRPRVCWLKRLYLDSDLRGTGSAIQMMQWAYAKARDWESARMELWSDTAFERAHAFYIKEGFQQNGQVRTMTDSWEPYEEFFFHMDLH